VRLEGLGQLKNPMTSRIEPATFRIVAQCLNKLRYLQKQHSLCSTTPITSLMHITWPISETGEMVKILVKYRVYQTPGFQTPTQERKDMTMLVLAV
jgi:hypothetical protein